MPRFDRPVYESGVGLTKSVNLPVRPELAIRLRKSWCARTSFAQ
jgi:hypothetical protein